MRTKELLSALRALLCSHHLFPGEMKFKRSSDVELSVTFLINAQLINKHHKSFQMILFSFVCEVKLFSGLLIC